MLNVYMSSKENLPFENESGNEPYNYPENNFVGTNGPTINVETKEFRYKEDYMSFLKDDADFSSIITDKPSLVIVFVPKADEDEIPAFNCLLPFTNINLFKDIHLYVRYKMIRPPSDNKLLKKSIKNLCEEFTNPRTAILNFINPNTGAKIIEEIRTKSDTPFFFHDDEVESWTLDEILETCSKQPTLLYLQCHGAYGGVTIGDGSTDRKKLFPKSEPFLTKAKTVPDIPLIIISKMCGGQNFITKEMMVEENIRNVKYISMDTDQCTNVFEFDETFATMWLTTMYFKEGEEEKIVGKQLLLDSERAVEKYNSIISSANEKKKLRIHQNGKPFRFKPSYIPWDSMIQTDDLDTVDKYGEHFIGGITHKSIPTIAGPVSSSSSSASTSRRTTSRRSKSRRSTRRGLRSRRTRRN